MDVLKIEGLPVFAEKGFCVPGRTMSDATSTSVGSMTLRGLAYGNGLFVATGENGTILTSSDGVNWASRTSGTSNFLQAVTFGNNIFVAVGSNGTVLTSPNGITWTSRTGGTSNVLYAVIFGNNTFVAVSLNGNIFTSPNGTAWTSRTSGTSNNIFAAAYGYEVFVSVGNIGTIIRFRYKSDTWMIAGGFLERIVLTGKTSYKLFDGKWLNFNSNGSVTWNE
jgi:hypothetical protein